MSEQPHECEHLNANPVTDGLHIAHGTIGSYQWCPDCGALGAMRGEWVSPKNAPTSKQVLQAIINQACRLIEETDAKPRPNFSGPASKPCSALHNWRDTGCSRELWRCMYAGRALAIPAMLVYEGSKVNLDAAAANCTLMADALLAALDMSDGN